MVPLKVEPSPACPGVRYPQDNDADVKMSASGSPKKKLRLEAWAQEYFSIASESQLASQSSHKSRIGEQRSPSTTRGNVCGNLPTAADPFCLPASPPVQGIKQEICESSGGDKVSLRMANGNNRHSPNSRHASSAASSHAQHEHGSPVSVVGQS